MSNPLYKEGNLPDPPSVSYDKTLSQDEIDSLPTLSELVGEEEAQRLIEELEASSQLNQHHPLIFKSSRMSPERVDARRKKLFEKGSKFAPVGRGEIVGIDNVLTQVDEVLDWLVNYREYAKYKARPEPGILFEGSPGTGKTYTSRYMATQSQALFVDVRDFPYTGKTLTAQDLKELFTLARQAHAMTNKPVILFWDEFEAVARERSRAGLSQEQQAVISQLTAELDGVTGKPAGILLIGCTNYGDDIDAALRRPGRMGLHIEFNAPNRVGKAKLLEHYINKVKTKGQIDFDTGSYFFDDWDTAATVEEAVQQAWRFAVHRWLTSDKPGRGPVLTQEDLVEIFLKRLVGPPPAHSEVTPETLYRVAVHETGHALAAILLGVGLRLVTIRPGREHLGKTMTYQADPRSSTMNELQAHIEVGVAGMVAERITGLPRGANSSGDTRAVTEIALDMVDQEAGGKRVGILNPKAMRKRFYDASPSISARVIEDSDLDIKALIDEAEKNIDELFANFGADKIRALADRLIKEQTFTGKQFEVEVTKIA